MDVITAIRGRRTTKEFRPDPVPRATIELLLEAAAWAPNHHLTQPWRFIVLEGAARMPLAELRRVLKARELAAAGAPPERVQRESDEAAQKLLRAPHLIIVACHTSGTAVEQEEDLVAVSAATMNLLLMATSLGIGTFWTSGPLGKAPETKRLLGLDLADKIIGIIHVGYPVELPTTSRKPDVDRVTTWVSPLEAPKLVNYVGKLVSGGG